MKNLIRLQLALLLALTIVGCEKSGTIVQNYKAIDFQEVNIGELHNKYLISCYSKIKRTGAKKYTGADSTELKNSINTEFKNIEYNPSIIGLSKDEFFDKSIALNTYLSLHNYDPQNMDEKYMTPEVNAYTNKILEVIENSIDLNDIYSKLDEVEGNVENNLSGLDLDIIRGTLIITRSSAYLWAPQEMGGLDLITQTFGRPENAGTSRTWWQGAIAGDAIASSQYFLGLGIAGAVGLATPGANSVILGGWAISAGIGSAYGALGL